MYSEEEKNHHLDEIFSNCKREEELPPCSQLVNPSKSTAQISNTLLVEVREVVNAFRTSVPPGPIRVRIKYTSSASEWWIGFGG